MKHLFVFFSILLISSSIFAQSMQKTGFVDTQIILAQLPAAIKAQSDLDATIAKWQKSRDSLTTILQNAYADFQKQQATMTPDKQREAQQTLVQMDQQIKEFEQQKFGQPNGEIYQKQEQLLNPVRESIYKAINGVATDEGLSFVFDKAGDVVLLYADSQYDVTYKVLDKLKRGK